jgi:hypothetical protein
MATRPDTPVEARISDLRDKEHGMHVIAEAPQVKTDCTISRVPDASGIYN